MTFMNRHNSEYKDELSRDDGLDQAQASRPQRLDLKGEPADHAGNADKPHGPTQQVTHETPIELHVG
jgi:MOSC domain-containing protein YiiM